MTGRYLHVLSSGPLIVVRLPHPESKWRDIVKALTPMMRSHGLRQKDVSSLEEVDEPGLFVAAYVTPDNWDQVARFWLYDFKAGSYVLVREGRP